MKISNNFIIEKKKNIVKKFLDNGRYNREIYFYRKYKSNNLNIPKIISVKKDKIIFKKYNFKKINSQKFFLEEFLKFLIKTNKVKKYKFFSKEDLKSYKNLQFQVLSRYRKLLRVKIKKKYLYKFNKIKSYISKILNEKPNNTKLQKMKRIVSQSDIGFHNCSISNRKLYFYDFEYAGLEHPIKMVCNIYYQPEKKMNKKYILEFIKNLQKYYKFTIPDNFIVFEKLYKVKMMLTILSIFINTSDNFKSKVTSKRNFDKLQLDRLNKAYRYITIPYLYENN